MCFFNPYIPRSSSNMLFAKALLFAIVPVALAVDHAVTIGLNNTLTFTPNQVIAAVGDTVTFTV